jgi:PIN domain nuclease of toxin-antitoxin system
MTKHTTRVEQSSTFNRWSFWDNAIACITDKTNEFLFPVESIWGVGIRGAIAKLPLPELSDRLLSIQPESDRIFITFSSSRSDHWFKLF